MLFYTELTSFFNTFFFNKIYFVPCTTQTDNPDRTHTRFLSPALPLSLLSPPFLLPPSLAEPRRPTRGPSSPSLSPLSFRPRSVPRSERPLSGHWFGGWVNKRTRESNFSLSYSNMTRGGRGICKHIWRNIEGGSEGTAGCWRADGRAGVLLPSLPSPLRPCCLLLFVDHRPGRRFPAAERRNRKKYIRRVVGEFSVAK